MNVQADVCMQHTQHEQAPRKVLFVCTGNTCRSPMAAAVFNDLARVREFSFQNGTLCCAPRLVASSAGLFANEGDPITPAAAKALRESGILPHPDNDYTAHRARPVSAELVSEADEIVGLTASHAMQLMLRFPEAASKIRTLPVDIADPFGGNDEIYRACLSQLRCAIELSYFAEGGHDA